MRYTYKLIIIIFFTGCYSNNNNQRELYANFKSKLSR